MDTAVQGCSPVRISMGARTGILPCRGAVRHRHSRQIEERNAPLRARKENLARTGARLCAQPGYTGLRHIDTEDKDRARDR